MNPWLMIVVIAVAVFISSMFRAQQRQRPPVLRRPPPPREPSDEPPNSADVPAVVSAPRLPRRAQPPPLPRGRKMPRVEIVTAAAALLPVGPPAPPPLGAAISPAKPLSRTALSLREMLKDPQMLGAAIVLREVLDEPLCRRRPKRHL